MNSFQHITSPLLHVQKSGPVQRPVPVDRTGIRQPSGILYVFRRIFLLLIALLPVLAATPQRSDASDVQIAVSASSSNVTIGEHFTFDVTIQSREPRNVSRPELPELDGMRYVSTVPRTGTSYSLINGVAQMTYRYTYTVQAIDSGAYQIPSVYVDIDGQEYAADPVTVVIHASSEEGVHSTPGDPMATRTDRRPIFLELELSEERPVRGQQVIAEIVLYFRNTIDVNNFHITRSWQTEGFWREDLNESQTRRAESVILGGMSYRRAVIARYALFPTRSGELTIPVFSIRASVRQSGRFRDEYSSFFDGFGRRRNVDLETSPKSLSVVTPPLPPSDGQHISALGRFTVERTLEKQRIKLGEAVDVITEISGSGNLGLISRPVMEYPASFDTHSPREVIERDKQAPRMEGVKQFRDVLIARSTGNFTISETTILTYNDASRRYERHILPELTLEVVRDPNARVRLATNDEFRLSPVRGSVTWSKGDSGAFYTMWWFWAALFVPVALFVFGLRSRRYLQKLSADDTFSRFELAYDKATERLEHAAARTNSHSETNIKTVYSCISRATGEFISDRLNLPAAGLTEKELIDALLQHNVDSNLSSRIFRLMQKCANIRYAPHPTPEDMDSDIAHARELIDELKPQL